VAGWDSVQCEAGFMIFGSAAGRPPASLADGTRLYCVTAVRLRLPKRDGSVPC